MILWKHIGLVLDKLHFFPYRGELRLFVISLIICNYVLFEKN